MTIPSDATSSTFHNIINTEWTATSSGWTAPKFSSEEVERCFKELHHVFGEIGVQKNAGNSGWTISEKDYEKIQANKGKLTAKVERERAEILPSTAQRPVAPSGVGSARPAAKPTPKTMSSTTYLLYQAEYGINEKTLSDQEKAKRAQALLKQSPKTIQKFEGEAVAAFGPTSIKDPELDLIHPSTSNPGHFSLSYRERGSDPKDTSNMRYLLFTEKTMQAIVNGAIFDTYQDNQEKTRRNEASDSKRNS